MVDLTPAWQFVADNSPTIDDINEASARLYALNKDCPAKTWWDADPMHPAIARALRIDPNAEGAVFARAMCRLATIEGRHLILVAYPAPRVLGPVDGDWLGIDHVIAWNPVDDSAAVLGDPQPQPVGPLDDGRLYASPRAFLTEWMRARAEFFVRWIQSRQGTWRHGATETDLSPGALAIGPVEKIRWRPSEMPENIECVGLDPAKLNRALLKAARVPRAHASQQRAVA